MQPTMSFTLLGGPGVRVTVVQTEDGGLRITASIIPGALVGDLRGLFFHVNDPALLAGLQVSDGTSPLGPLQTGSNAISNLGGGVNMAGAAAPFDAGLTFGTASAAGADDIRSVSFTLSHASQTLTLDTLAQMQFGAVMTSVGLEGGPRVGTVRSVGSAPGNLAPDAVADSAGVGEDGSVAIAVLANDTDPHHDPLAISGFTQPAAGVVTQEGSQLRFDAAGAFDWLAVGEQTAVTFTYSISDGRGGSDSATVTVTVTGANDLPSAEDLDVLVLEDGGPDGSVAGSLLAGATDPDLSDVLQVVAVNGGPAAVVEGLYGTLTWAADGSYTYVVDDSRAATNALRAGEEATDSFTFTVADGQGGEDGATLTVYVVGANDAPAVVDDSRTVLEDGVLSGSVAGLASDPEGDALTFALVGPAPAGLVFNADGTYTYTPPADFDGAVSFQFLANDGLADSNTGTVTIDVIPVNDAPTDIQLSGTSVAENSAVGTLIGLLSATDVDGGPASFSFVGPSGPFQILGNRLEVGGPLDFETQSSYSVTIRADDGAGGTYDETFVITVTDVDEDGTNAPPTVTDDGRTMAEDGTLDGSVAGLASDPDGDPLTFALVGGGLPGLVFNADGSYLYTPPADFHGEVSFQFRANDGAADSNTGTVTITVTPVNDAPTVRSETYAATEDTPRVFSIAALLADLAGDVDGDPIGFVSATSPGGGTLSISGDELTFTPAPDYAGSGWFFLTVTDGALTGGNWVYLDIAEVNDAPVAADDQVIRSGADPQVIARAALFANDSDIDSPPAGWSIVLGAAVGGSVALDTNGDVVFDLDPGHAGAYSFQYRVDDGEGGLSNLATVTLNGPPAAGDDAYEVAENDAYNAWQAVDVLANDSDPDGDPLTVTAASLLGTAPIVVSWDADQVFFYSTDSAWSGSFQILYGISDGRGGTDTAIVSVTVTPSDDAPVAVPDYAASEIVTTDELTPVLIPFATLMANDWHEDGTSFTITAVHTFHRGTATLADTNSDTVPDAVLFTPQVQNGNFYDFDDSWLAYFYYTVTDADGDTAETYAYVRVNDVNQAPDARDDVIARGISPHVIPFATLFANDLDYDSPQSGWTITGISNQQGVSVVVDNSARTVTVTYTPGFGGTYGFDYTVSDGEGGSDTATVVLDSAPAQTGPVSPLVIDEDSAQFIEDAVLIALAGVTDPDGDTLFVTGPVIPGPNLHAFDAWGAPVPYYVYVATSLLDWNGASTLTFTVSDGHPGGQIAVTIPVVVQPVNDPPRDPQGNDDALGLATAEDTPLIVSIADLLGDDFNPADEAQVVNLFDFGAWWYGIHSVVDNGNGTLTVTPLADFEGVTRFYYRTQDEQGAVSGIVTVALTVTGVPDPIDARDDDIARTGAASQTVLAGQMLGNDVDPDVGDTKDIISVAAVNGITAITLNGDDSVTVTFAESYVGRASYTYTVRDSQGHEDTATVELFRTILANPDGPFTFEEANNSYLYIPYATLFANDLEGDGGALYIYDFNAGYAGSNVYVGGGWMGVYVYLIDNSYSGPAEFQYRAWDGVAVSNWATVTLDVVAGNDAPVAQDDYWFYNGARYADTDPATNPMAGTEDTVMEFAASLLLDGQFIGGWYQTGRDSDEEGDPIAILASSLSSPFGTVELVNLGGEDIIRFTPNADVNSHYPWGVYGYYNIWFSYQVTDGDRDSNTAYVYLYLAGTDDAPDAVDDSFIVLGSGPWVLPIGNVYSPFWVLANDSSPDDYPYPIDYGYTTITGVAIVSGIASLDWDGYRVVVTPDGSGDPVVFSYTITDADGDSDTAFVTLNPAAPEPQRFYFRGTVPAYGSELWVFDPASNDAGLGTPFATMVDVAETWAGAESGNPREITALGGTVFWRGTVAYDTTEGTFTYDAWHRYAPSLGYADLGYYVGYGAFDAALALEEQNLGVRAGDLFWGAAGDSFIVAWDQLGTHVASSYLPGFDRHLLTDAGGQPAYAATTWEWIWNPDLGENEYLEVEQLFAILPSFYGWSSLQVSAGGHAGNDIREIAAGSIIAEPSGSGEIAKTFYFAGDFANTSQGAHDNGLWRITLTSYGYGWFGYSEAELISADFMESNPHDLTMAKVSDGAGGFEEWLFWFQLNALGNGELAARHDDYWGGFGVSTGTSYFGEAFEGLEIRQWQDGVIFSGIAASGAFVATFAGGSTSSPFSLGYVLGDQSGVIEQLVVDGQGSAAFLVDEGASDILWHWDGTTLWFVDSKVGEITDLQIASGTIVYVAPTSGGAFTSLWSYDIATQSLLEVPTDEPTDVGPLYGYYAPEDVTAVPDPLDYLRMMEAWYAGGGGIGGGD